MTFRAPSLLLIRGLSQAFLTPTTMDTSHTISPRLRGFLTLVRGFVGGCLWYELTVLASSPLSMRVD
jgi:hypothetical protein